MWNITLTKFGHAEQYKITSETIVNLAGIWSDKVNAVCQQTDNQIALPTMTVKANKGCHVMAKLPAEFVDIGIINRNEIGHLFMSVP